MIARFMISTATNVAKLGDAVEFLDSLRRPVTESERRAGPYPYYGANGQQGSVDDYIFDEPLILLAEDGGHFGEPDRGVAYRISGKTWVNNHAHVLRPKADFDINFLCRVLENYDLTPWITGTTRGKLTQASASEILIPRPTLPEQRRIAKILDKADALRAKRRAALAQLDTLTQSIFVDMFGDPVRAGWKMTTLSDVGAGAAAIRTGPFGSQLLHSEFVDEGVAVLGIDNAVENEFRWMQRRFITEAKYRKLSRYTVYPGDVLITLMGTCGRCAVVPDDVPLAINTKHLCCITVDRAKCLPEFLRSYFLRHPIAQRYLRQTAKGAIMDGLNMGIIKATPVPLAPMSLQERFAELVQRLSRVRNEMRRSASEFESMFASVQHRAFREEL